MKKGITYAMLIFGGCIVALMLISAALKVSENSANQLRQELDSWTE